MKNDAGALRATDSQRQAQTVPESQPRQALEFISTGSFVETPAILGPSGKILFASMLARLKAAWRRKLKAWRSRHLSARQYGPLPGRLGLIHAASGWGSSVHADCCRR